MTFSSTSIQNPLIPVDMTLLESAVFPKVFKPGRYIGNEQGAYRKSFQKADVTMAVAFPDLYEIGISNYGLKLLYSLVNQHPRYACDRVYAPALDFKAALAEVDVPLYGVESKLPLKQLDVLAFSLQYELNYSTILGILESAQIPFRSVDRQSEAFPLLIAGGPGSANPMPLAPFFDAFIIGDGEEVLIEILDVVSEAKKKHWPKAQLLQALAKLEGLYIPGLTPKAHKRIIDIAEHQVDLAPLVPLVAGVHDRVVVEARRGCDRMCRFCQPCFINLPVREQSIETIKKNALQEIEKTGYEECSLLSLSIADYSYLKPLITEVSDALKEKNVSLSLPSQRADRFNLEVAEAVQTIRKSTLTFAPEAGTPRLRDVINKNLTDAEIMNAVTTAYRSGWNKVKLYFILGLPTETNEDLDGIYDLVIRMREACQAIKREPGLSIKDLLEVNLTLSNFVPKPHTPFQWFPQDSMATMREKISYIRDRFRGLRGVKINYTDPEISQLEAAIAKGDETLAEVLEAAYRKGAYLDAWDDVENFQKWYQAFSERGIEIEHLTREQYIEPDEPLPWDPIDVGLDKQWLKEEYERATRATSTTPCFEACSTCGVCATYSTWPKFIETPTSKPVLKVVAQNSKPTSQLVKLPMVKMRLTIEKRDQMKFISHLDWLRLLHRAIARAKLPVAYSQGFNPKPKTAFSPALPLFTEGYQEYWDVELTESVDKVAEKLNQFLPEGGKVLSEVALPVSAPSIEKSILTMTYSARWTCKDIGKEYTISERVKHLVTQPTLAVEVDTKKSRKSLDLAPYLADLRMVDGNTLQFQINRVAVDPGETLIIKPQWVLSLIDSEVQWSITRTGMVLST